MSAGDDEQPTTSASDAPPAGEAPPAGDVPPAGDAPPTGDDESKGAVATGRTIDPSKLVVRGRTEVRHRKRPPKQKTTDGAAEGAAAPGAGSNEAGTGGADGSGAEGGDRKKRKRRRPKRRVVEKDELYAKKEPTSGKPGERGRAVLPPRPNTPIVAPDPEGKSFAELFAEQDDPGGMDLSTGDRVEGEVVVVGKDSVFLSLGPSVEATLSIAEVLDDDGVCTVAVGDRVEAYVVKAGGGIELSKKLGRHGFDPGLLEDAKESGIPVDGQVTGHNKGGLEVSLHGARGFCPLGQADLGYVEDPGSMVGKTFSFVITELKNGGREVVLSRRRLLEREREEAKGKTLAELSVRARRRGKVTRVQPFGAFVDIGGVDGLIPLSEMSFGHLKDPTDAVSVGDEVEVEILRIEPDPKREGELRIGLSLKHALEDPFDRFADEVAPGRNVEGTVTLLKPFGAFVELLEAGSGLTGLVHISEIADRRIATPGEVLEVGQAVTVRVLDVDRGERRISLSIKEAERPERAPGETAQQAATRAGWNRGAEVTGVVDRIERYGVFVQVEGLGSALLPASESGVPRGQDLGKAMPLGTELTCLVIDVDERGRAKLSKTAKERQEEKALVGKFGGGSSGSLGTLGDLLKAKMGSSDGN